MKCNTNLIYALISIIVIVIIVILIFNKTDTNFDTIFDANFDKNFNTNLKHNNNHKGDRENKFNTTNIIENFDVEQTIIDNNIYINSLLSQLNNVAEISVSANTDNINKNFINNISSNVNAITSNISNYYNTNNNSDSGVIKNITGLENNLTDLENMIKNMNLIKVRNKEYSTIKSLNNGMDMQLIKTPNTYFTDLKTGSNTAAYLLMMNKGCLSVGANDYDVYKCNDKNPKQYFKIQNILNEKDYTNNIDLSLPSGTDDLSAVTYPFAMIKSVNNDNCLTNNHGNITVQPCYSFVAQRWMPL